MARRSGEGGVGVPHNVTQRGNARQIILATHADRLIYMALLREYAQLYRLSLLGYCLMSGRKRGTDGTDPNFFSQSGNGEAIITSVSAGACTAFDMFSLWLAVRERAGWGFPIMLRSAAMPDKSFSLPMPIV